MSVVNLLGLRGGSMAMDKALAGYIMKTHAVALAEVVQELVDSSAFGRSESELHVIAQCTTVGQLEDDGGVVSLERAKLDRWCAAKGLKPTFMTIVRT